MVVIADEIESQNGMQVSSEECPFSKALQSALLSQLLSLLQVLRKQTEG
jgi:hypothetical protein